MLRCSCEFSSDVADEKQEVVWAGCFDGWHYAGCWLISSMFVAGWLEHLAVFQQVADDVASNTESCSS
jgi:hypothetical protein